MHLSCSAIAWACTWACATRPLSPPLRTPVEVSQGYVSWPGGVIHYLIGGGGGGGGGGPTLVLLHAGSGNASLWRAQWQAFADAGLRVVAYDRSQHGQSSRAQGDEAYDSSAELDALLSALNLSKVHLLGVAAGGGVALRYAVNHRDRIESLIIANSLGDVTDESYLRLGDRLRPAQFYELPLELRELGPSYRASDPEGAAMWLALSTQAETALASTQRLVTGEPALRKVLAGEFTQATQYSVTFARLGAIGRPTLFMTGDADLYTPPSVLSLFASAMPGSCAVVIPQSGHASFWENPVEFNRAVLCFLSQQEAINRSANSCRC